MGFVLVVLLLVAGSYLVENPIHLLVNCIFLVASYSWVKSMKVTSTMTMITMMRTVTSKERLFMSNTIFISLFD